MQTGLRPISFIILLAASLGLLTACGASGGSDVAQVSTTTTTAAAATTTSVTTVTEPTTTAETTAETPTAGGEGPDLCAALKRISDFDATTEDAATRTWAEAQQTLVDGTKGSLGAYDDAITAANPDLAADLTTLRKFTVLTTDVAAQSSSLTDFGTKLVEVPDIMEAGQAGRRLDSYARINCGFGTTSNGG